MIQKIFNRHPEGLVAKCECCGLRGASAHVPYKIEYWPKEQSGQGGNIAYRCENHAPGLVAQDDLSQIEIDTRKSNSQARRDVAG